MVSIVNSQDALERIFQIQQFVVEKDFVFHPAIVLVKKDMLVLNVKFLDVMVCQVVIQMYVLEEDNVYLQKNVFVRLVTPV